MTSDRAGVLPSGCQVYVVRAASHDQQTRPVVLQFREPSDHEVSPLGRAGSECRAGAGVASGQGLDSLDPVVPGDATRRGEFTGTIHKVVIDIGPEAFHDHDLTVRARYRKQ